MATTISNTAIITASAAVSGTVQGAPTIVVDKQLNTTPSDPSFSVGETISFTIRITNTGGVTITTLPLEDRYSSAFMTYKSASITPTTESDGILTWCNLITTGFGISKSLSLDVFFTAAADTTLLPPISSCSQDSHTPNLARSVGAMAGGSAVVEDADDTSCDSVQILNSTGIQLADRSITQTPDGPLVSWTTVSELEILGFKFIFLDGVESQLRSNELLPAKSPGQDAGNEYQWLDSGTTLSYGRGYALEIIKSDGTVIREVIGIMNETNLFLPFVMN